MGNHIAVMDKDKNMVGEMHISLACFALINRLVEKYNPGKNLINPETVNGVLEVVYQNCEDYEEIQLLVFINDKSSFNRTDISRLNKAIDRYSMLNDEPKKHLIFIRDLIEKHGELHTEYVSSSAAITVVKS